MAAAQGFWFRERTGPAIPRPRRRKAARGGSPGVGTSIRLRQRPAAPLPGRFTGGARGRNGRGPRAGVAALPAVQRDVGARPLVPDERDRNGFMGRAVARPVRAGAAHPELDDRHAEPGDPAAGPREEMLGCEQVFKMPKPSSSRPTKPTSCNRKGSRGTSASSSSESGAGAGAAASVSVAGEGTKTPPVRDHTKRRRREDLAGPGGPACLRRRRPIFPPAGGRRGRGRPGRPARKMRAAARAEATPAAARPAIRPLPPPAAPRPWPPAPAFSRRFSRSSWDGGTGHQADGLDRDREPGKRRHHHRHRGIHGRFLRAKHEGRGRGWQ